MANWREELLFEKGPFDKPDSVLRRDADAEAKKDAREKKAKKAAKSAKDYRKILKGTLEYKKERLKWQQGRSLIKDKERRKREQESRISGPLKDIKTQTISGKDSDSTAGAKLVGNAASLVGGVAKAGAAAFMQRRKEMKKREKKQRIKAGTEKAQQKASEIKTSMTQPRLPAAGRTLGQQARANKSIKQREISSRMSEPNNKPQPKPRDNWTQRAVNRIEVFNKPKRSTDEEYSCWREEFLCELGDMRREKKKDKNDRTVNVMTGKNKITLFPTIVESHDDDMEMFRQHSKENAPESSGHTPGRARTSKLLAKMRELGMQTEPKKKKKNKKKRVIDEAGPVLSVGRGEKLSVERGGGLTAKGRAKYNRATGSNLQAPVTGDVKPGSKAAQRRKNFCSRSRSWNGERGLAARRRWKC
jgi:hypothetical protein